MKAPYKLPIIVRSKNGDWFVKYWYELPDQPGVYKEFRSRDGVNYVKDLKKKGKAQLPVYLGGRECCTYTT
jgi:hypothetical protein